MMTRCWMRVLLAACLLVSSVAASSFNRLRHRHMGTTGSNSVDFIDQCTSSLLSGEAVADDLISQDEFSQFLSDYCIQLNVCQAGTELDFENLSVELQLAFVLFICNQEQEVERKACLEELNGMGGSFGYNLNVEEFEVLKAEIVELCSLAFYYASMSGLLPPTIAPSQVAPTAAPTEMDDASTAGGGVPTDGEGNDPNGGAGAGTEGDGLSPGNDSVSTGLIVGVTVAGVVIALAATFLAFRRRKRRTGVKDQQKYITNVDIAGDESIFTEDSAAFNYIPKGMDSFYYSAHSVGSGSAKSGRRSSRSGSSGERLPKDVVTGVKSRSVAQFDPSNAAAAIALGIDGQIIGKGSVSSSRSSQRSSSALSTDSDRHGKMKNLTVAIEMADWDEVARLAGNMATDSDSEEVSTMSEYSNAREDLSRRSSVSSVNSGNSIRAAQIEEMVLRGDWSGVATAAQFFSSTKSQGSAGSGVARSTADSPKRSFLDFVTGRRSAPSAAASAAIVPNSPDLVEHDSDMSEAGLAHVGAAEDIPSVLEAGRSNTQETQSSSSHGSRQGSPEKQKKRWFGRLISSRNSKKRSSDSSEAVPTSQSGNSEEGAATPTASSSAKELQAELNKALERGDWGAIEAISAKLDESGGVSSSRKAASGKSNAVGGEKETTLGATSLSALKKSAKRPGDRSVVTYRADIDKAVAEGDWEAVERLTTQILNTKPASRKDGMGNSLLEMNRTPSPSKSPFRATPSSSEWSRSPSIEEDKMQKIRRLISAKDWKGIHVLSGIYEMEDNGTLPPTFASMSNDSAESTEFAQGWLRGDSSGTPPPPEVEGVARLPPPSPSTSTSTGASTELREFERLVNAKDWKGLAYFAGAEDGLDLEDDGELLPRNLFQLDPLAPRKSNEQTHANEQQVEHVDLRETDGPQSKILKREDSEADSIHGTELLIPHWQELVDKNSPDASNERDSNDGKK